MRPTFELAARTWSAESAAELDLPDLLPPVFESGTVVGQVSHAAAEATGLTAGTPVVAAGADTQLALLGAGLTEPGQFATVGGTFWQTAAVLDQPLVDPRIRLRTLCHVLPGTWMIEGIGGEWTPDALDATGRLFRISASMDADRSLS